MGLIWALIAIASVLILVALIVLFVLLGTDAKDRIESGEDDRGLIKERLEEDEDARRIQSRIGKAWQVIASFFYWLIFASAIIVLSFSWYSRAQGNYFPWGSDTLMVIRSNSMATVNPSNTYIEEYSLYNQFSKGDILILSKKPAEEDIKQYDIIAFKDQRTGLTMVHRIKEIRSEDGIIHYLTRGDANNVSDIYLPTYEDIIGKYTNVRFVGLGWFILFIQSSFGYLTLASMALSYVIYTYYKDYTDGSKKDRQDTIIGLSKGEIANRISSSPTQKACRKMYRSVMEEYGKEKKRRKRR